MSTRKRSNLAGKKSKKTDLPSRSEVVVKELEEKWYIPPVRYPPKNKTVEDNDKNCPRAQMDKLNKIRKMAADQIDIAEQKKRETSKKWINMTLENPYSIAPQKLNSSVKNIAASDMVRAVQESPMEVEILKKVVVRENLLLELKKLIEKQDDLVACLGEVVELVKAIRFQTLDIVEDIDAWINKQINQTGAPSSVMSSAAIPSRPFLYRGMNYMFKICEDLEFLDQYEEVVEKFCFEFKMNPLAYRGGGNIITGFGRMFPDLVPDRQHASDGKYSNSFRQTVAGASMDNSALLRAYSENSIMVDGIEVGRLRNAERAIQREFERRRAGPQGSVAHAVNGTASVVADGSMTLDEPLLGTEAFVESIDGSLLASRSLPNLHQDSSMASGADQKGLSHTLRKGLSKEHRPSPGSMKKYLPKFDERKVKMERIAVLAEEIGALKASQVSFEEQVEKLVSDYRELDLKKQTYEAKRREALAQDRDIAAQKLGVEISFFAVELQDINMRIKDIQRQSYFLGLERNRKQRLRKRLEEEIEADKKRKVIEAKIQAHIKKEGLISAIRLLDDKSLMTSSGTPKATLSGSSINREGFRVGTDTNEATAVGASSPSPTRTSFQNRRSSKSSSSNSRSPSKPPSRRASVNKDKGAAAAVIQRISVSHISALNMIGAAGSSQDGDDDNSFATSRTDDTECSNGEEMNESRHKARSALDEDSDDESLPDLFAGMEEEEKRELLIRSQSRKEAMQRLLESRNADEDAEAVSQGIGELKFDEDERADTATEASYLGSIPSTTATTVRAAMEENDDGDDDESLAGERVA